MIAGFSRSVIVSALSIFPIKSRPVFILLSLLLLRTFSKANSLGDDNSSKSMIAGFSRSAIVSALLASSFALAGKNSLLKLILS